MAGSVLPEARCSSTTYTLAKGDRDELSRVFGSQRERLFLRARRVLGNHEDAEGAVQDGLVAALRSLHRSKADALDRDRSSGALIECESRDRQKEVALADHFDQCTSRGQIPAPRLEASSDRERLTDLFRSQRQRLFYAAWRLLGNVEDAEDAVQEGLLAALRNLHRFEGRARLSTWLTRIVLNAALMRLRSLRTHESVPIDETAAEQGGVRLSELLVDSRPNPEEACVRTERRRILNQHLKRLSLSQRRALSLHDLDGMTTQETAHVLGLSEGTVKSQVYRARRHLVQQVRRIQQGPASANLARA
jgi:RNA polymerase sigma-70 factor, ECF subfamily